MKTRTPWDDNQELIGQGLAKIAAAFSQSIPVSGSFSRSALNLSVNARTGMSSVFSARLRAADAAVFHAAAAPPAETGAGRDHRYRADQSRRLREHRKAWRARGDDGIAAVVTFITTLAFAPNIQIGILTGIMLSLALLLYRLMRPRVAVVGMHADGTLRDAEYFQLAALHSKLGALRFDGSLFFVNVSYFEEAIIKARAQQSRPQIHTRRRQRHQRHRRLGHRNAVESGATS